MTARFVAEPTITQMQCLAVDAECPLGAQVHGTVTAPTWGEPTHYDGPPGPEEESRERVDSAKNRASAPSRLRFACVTQQTARFEFHWFCRLKLPTDTLLTYRAIRKPRQAALTDHLVNVRGHSFIRELGFEVLRKTFKFCRKLRLDAAACLLEVSSHLRHVLQHRVQRFRDPTPRVPG